MVYLRVCITQYTFFNQWHNAKKTPNHKVFCFCRDRELKASDPWNFLRSVSIKCFVTSLPCNWKLLVPIRDSRKKTTFLLWLYFLAESKCHIKYQVFKYLNSGLVNGYFLKSSNEEYISITSLCLWNKDSRRQYIQL